MSNPKPEEVIVDVNEVYTKSESWVIENQKSLTIIAGAVVLMLLSYFAYNNFLYMPKEEEAREYMWQAQQAFSTDSFELALNGKPGTDFYGFLTIIDEYGITAQANLAHYYAGICYLRMGQYNEAIEMLQDFDCKDVMVCSVSIGATGDAYMELGEVDKAIEYYLSAADKRENELTTPIYLMKAARAYESVGDYQEALNAYTRIKQDFPEHQDAQDIDKYIARAETLIGS